MAERTSPTTVMDAAELTALTSHRTSTGTDHLIVAENEVESICASLELQTLNNEKSAALGGSAAKYFIPEAIEVVVLSASGAPNGDAQITCGTSAGGTQILPATPLTGMVAAGEAFVITLGGRFAAIAGNATLYAKCTTADTKGGCTCVATVRIVGRQRAI